MPWVRAGLTRVVRRAIRKRCLRQTRLSVERSAAGCWTGTRSLLHEMRWTVAKMRPHWLRVRRRKPGSAVGDYLPSGLILQCGSARCYGECEGECAPVTRLALDTYTTAVESASVRKRTSLYAGNPRSNDVPTSRSRECSRQARVHVPHRLAGSSTGIAAHIEAALGDPGDRARRYAASRRVRVPHAAPGGRAARCRPRALLAAPAPPRRGVIEPRLSVGCEAAAPPLALLYRALARMRIVATGRGRAMEECAYGESSGSVEENRTAIMPSVECPGCRA